MNKRKSQTIRLSVMLFLTFSFFIVELVVGYVTDSLALISDSYHMLSDTIALVVGLACVRISYWNSPNNTYGWVRAEILGALVNSVFLIALCFTILTDGITRLITPEEIENVDLLLYVGIAGLAINVFGLIMFCSDTQGGHHGHSHGGGGGGGHHGHSHGGGGHHGHSHGSGVEERGMRHRDGSEHGSVGGGGGHGHSHEAVKNHSTDSDSDHGYASVKVDVTNGRPPRTIEWLPPSTVTMVENNAYENSIHQVTVTIDSNNCEVENQTTIDDEEEDTISYIEKKGLMQSGSQMNMLGVFLHVFGDALGSVVVIVSALVIKFVHEPWVYRLDPAMSIIMTIIILSTTIPLFEDFRTFAFCQLRLQVITSIAPMLIPDGAAKRLQTVKQSAMVLLQTVPTHIKISELQEKLLNKVNGIAGLHEFHVWQLTGQRIVASGHIRVDNLTDYTNVANKVKSFFHDEGIHSTTFQPEFTENVGEPSTAEMKRDCALECGPDKTCFENTCCSNKLKKSKKNANGSTSSSIDAGTRQETNKSFEMVDETTTTTTSSNRDTPSSKGKDEATNEVEMGKLSTHI